MRTLPRPTGKELKQKSCRCRLAETCGITECWGEIANMNDHQKLYFDQAKSDFEIFQFLKGKPACHRLHYLQMCTEKLGKAFFFKKPPPYPSHAGFVKFLRNLSTRRNIWRALNFGRREDLELYVR